MLAAVEPVGYQLVDAKGLVKGTVDKHVVTEIVETTVIADTDGEALGVTCAHAGITLAHFLDFGGVAVVGGTSFSTVKVVKP